jgi:hypothetical protein
MSTSELRKVEYYRIKKDNSWDIEVALIPFEIPYENSVDYIWYTLSDLNFTKDIHTIVISTFSEEMIINKGI